MGADNRTLHRAKRLGRDEFYTQLVDIEAELRHYRHHFAGKVVYLNCDDPRESNFFLYFALNFRSLGLRRLIATSYAGSPVAGSQLSFDDLGVDNGGRSHKLVIDSLDDFTGDGRVDLGDVDWVLRNVAEAAVNLEGGGDFRSPECVDLLREADIVVTNPPFSLFREYVAQLVDHGKKFLILGQQNAITYKETFSLIKNGQMWLGVDNGGTKWFQVPDGYDIETESRKKMVDGVQYFSMGSVNWFTNLDHSRRHEELPLFRRYAKTPEDYPRYDNYDAIEVSRVKNIPEDYDGVMGVPITFLDKHNPEQFEILGHCQLCPIAIGYNCWHIDRRQKQYTAADTPDYGELNRR